MLRKVSCLRLYDINIENGALHRPDLLHGHHVAADKGSGERAPADFAAFFYGNFIDVDRNVCGIISSGYSDHPVMSACREHGFRECLIKPYGIGDLRTAMERALEGPND